MIDAAFTCALGGFALDAAFAVPARGVTALFGPSGSGKTTILRCMAGLHRAAGRFSIAGDPWQDDAAGLFRRPHQRPIGYVFQEASLFPHLSVRRNLLFGARRAGTAGEGDLAFAEVVDLLGIASLLDRSPERLSGGERQRVAVGRALLSQPRLLLMDEPLSALDRRTKDEILPYFEALHERLSLPIVYVSHDIAEVERLADTLVLLDQGRVLAAGPLATLEADPALPLLQAPEAAVTLDARVAELDVTYHLTTLSVAGGRLMVPGQPGPIGSHRRVRIKASDVSFALRPPVETTILNCLPARILSIERLVDTAAQAIVLAELTQGEGGARIAARITRRSLDALSLAPGREVYAQIKSVAVVASGR